MSGCPACPLRGRETACLGATEPAFAYFCARAVEGEATWLDQIVLRSAAGYMPPPPVADESALNPHAGRDLLVRGCDYRLDAVGLERGEGCGCTPMTRCLLGRGKWADDVSAVDYSDCLACINGR